MVVSCGLEAMNDAGIMGEMGSRWGVNRTAAQIHALLFLAGRPLHAEEICATLGVARSNLSNSLRVLLDSSEVKREPAISRQRRGEMLAQMDTLSAWSDEMLRLDSVTLVKVMKLGARVQSLLRGKPG